MSTLLLLLIFLSNRSFSLLFSSLFYSVSILTSFYNPLPCCFKLPGSLSVDRSWTRRHWNIILSLKYTYRAKIYELNIVIGHYKAHVRFPSGYRTYSDNQPVGVPRTYQDFCDDWWLNWKNLVHMLLFETGKLKVMSFHMWLNDITKERKTNTKNIFFSWPYCTVLSLVSNQIL